MVRERRLNPHLLARYVAPLPIPSIARSSETRVSPSDVNIRVPYYRIEIRQFEVQLHRDLPPTSQWGYDSAVLGPTFETRRSTRRERRARTCRPLLYRRAAQSLKRGFDQGLANFDSSRNEKIFLRSASRQYFLRFAER
jgi:hypothetical protein